MTILLAALAVSLAGSLVYSVLSVIAAIRYLSVKRPLSETREPISILKPLAGLDEGLEDNLRSFFTQVYPYFEIIFAVREASDPCVPLVRKLAAEYPQVPSRLLLVGDPPYPHAKVYSLARMLAVSQHDLVVMSDSDVRVSSDSLHRIAAEFSDGRTALATCPYRAVAGRSFWSQLEALGMNTTFWQGVLTARLLSGMNFAVGPTIAGRNSAISSIGGIERVKDYIAEDFDLGRIMAEAGKRVILSSYVIEHRIGSEPWRFNFSHRLRWARTSRRSRPLGYIGQIFTYPLPLALLLWMAAPRAWPLVAITASIRYASAWMVSQVVLGSRLHWLLLPVEDISGFLFWVAGFFGSTVQWRGRTYRIDRQGRAVA